MEVFVLRSVVEPQSRHSFVVPVGGQFSVGRKSCALVISDASISRQHALFSHCLSSNQLTLTDKSKFGTFLNGKKLSSGVAVPLQCGNEVQFANYRTVYKVCLEKLHVCLSNVPKCQKKQVLAFARENDITVEQEVSLRTHFLVMSGLMATMKVFAALLLSREIVTPEFLIGGESSSPDKKHPPILEQLLDAKKVDIGLSSTRMKLLSKLNFLFVNEDHQQRMTPILASGGAKSALFTGVNCAPKDASTIVLIQSAEVMNQNVSLKRCLEERGHRPITDCEFGLAVLYCDTANYCNPAAPLPREMRQSSGMVQESAIVTQTMPPLQPDLPESSTQSQEDQSQDNSQNDAKHEGSATTKRRLNEPQVSDSSAKRTPRLVASEAASRSKRDRRPTLPTKWRIADCHEMLDILSQDVAPDDVADPSNVATTSVNDNESQQSVIKRLESNETRIREHQVVSRHLVSSMPRSRTNTQEMEDEESVTSLQPSADSLFSSAGQTTGLETRVISGFMSKHRPRPAALKAEPVEEDSERRGHLVVSYASLVVRRDSALTPSQVSNRPDAPNFKKFRKVPFLASNVRIRPVLDKSDDFGSSQSQDVLHERSRHRQEMSQAESVFTSVFSAR